MKNIKKIHFKDLLKKMENSYISKYSEILQKIQFVLIQFTRLIEGIKTNLLYIVAIEKKNPNLKKMVKKCLESLETYFNTEYSYIDIESLKTIINLTKQLQYFKVAFHSLHHLEYIEKSSVSKELKKINSNLKQLEEIPNELRSLIDRNSLIYSYITKQFNDIGKYVKKFSRECSVGEKTENEYIMAVNKLFGHLNGFKGRNKVSDVDYKKIIFNLKERQVIVKKIELMLEYPRHLAFQCKTFNLNLEIPGFEKPKKFGDFVKNLNNQNFVLDKLLSYELKDVLISIRYLFKTEEENEQISFFDVIYNEEIFIDLMTKFRKNQLKLNCITDDYYTIKEDYKINNNNECNSLNALGDKIITFLMKLDRFNQFNKNFNKFREKCQIFFFEEFEMVINVYY